MLRVRGKPRIVNILHLKSMGGREGTEINVVIASGYYIYQISYATPLCISPPWDVSLGTLQLPWHSLSVSPSSVLGSSNCGAAGRHQRGTGGGSEGRRRGEVEQCNIVCRVCMHNNTYHIISIEQADSI